MRLLRKTWELHVLLDLGRSAHLRWYFEFGSKIGYWDTENNRIFRTVTDTKKRNCLNIEKCAQLKLADEVKTDIKQGFTSYWAFWDNSNGLGCNLVKIVACSIVSTNQALSIRLRAASRRSATHNRAETVRARLLGFQLAQVPDVPVDTIEGVPLKLKAPK